MVDIHTIINDHRSRANTEGAGPKSSSLGQTVPTVSEIPDLFFDEILVNFKLTRVETIIVMYLYRRVWCRPNLYKEYGISQLLSHTDMAKNLSLSMEDVHNGLRRLEEYGFITTIRSGQYFVRKYFTKESDEKFGQTYDDFEV